MKIAVVVAGGLHPSGRDQVVPSWLALFEALAKTHEIHAFALRHLPNASTYKLLGFTVHDLGRPSAPFGFTPWAQERALLAALSANAPFDLIHGFWGDPAGQLAARTGRRLGIPSIVTCDSGEFVSIPDIDYGSLRTRRGQRAIWDACSAARVHVCTSFMASLAAQHGVDTTVIPLTTVRAGVAARPKSDTPGFRLLQVASLSRVKNQRMLIETLAIVSRHIDVRLDLVGEDTLGGELQRQAERQGVAGRVTFHGFLPQHQLAERYAAADLYVQSSLHEAAGVSVLEAAAAGVPVTGTRVGYVADWAKDRALAMDSPDTGSMARAIFALHTDGHRARAMAARAQAWAHEHDAGWAAGQFDELYRDLLAPRLSPQPIVRS